MTKKQAPSFFDQLLDKASARVTQSVISDNKPLAEAIQEFLSRKAAGDPKCAHLTLNWFYTNCLRSEFDGPVCMNTVRKYVRDILKLDPSTGNPL